MPMTCVHVGAPPGVSRLVRQRQWNTATAAAATPLYCYVSSVRVLRVVHSCTTQQQQQQSTTCVIQACVFFPSLSFIVYCVCGSSEVEVVRNVKTIVEAIHIHITPPKKLLSDTARNRWVNEIVFFFHLAKRRFRTTALAIQRTKLEECRRPPSRMPRPHMVVGTERTTSPPSSIGPQIPPRTPCKYIHDVITLYRQTKEERNSQPK